MPPASLDQSSEGIVESVLMRAKSVFASVGCRLAVGSALTTLDSPAPRRRAGDASLCRLRKQPALQQQWLRKRVETFLPPLMRKHGIDLWIVPMRECNEDPVFSALVAPETFAARRRRSTCSSTSARAAASAECVERIALGGTSQGPLGVTLAGPTVPGEVTPTAFAGFAPL
jgi:hypothetical protein